MGKGSRTRPRSVSNRTYAENYDRIFASNRSGGAAVRRDAWCFSDRRDGAWQEASPAARTRKDALEEALAFYNDGDVATARRVPVDPWAYFPDASELLARMCEHAEQHLPFLRDIGSEVYANVAPDSLADLDSLLASWVRAHVRLDAWTAEDIEEHRRPGC